MSAVRASGPFVDLEPLQGDDRAYLKGRDADQRVVIANLRTAALTILYGAAGVGKSSLLLAGVVPSLRESRPRTPLVVFRDWISADPAGRLARACVAETERLGFALPADAAARPLDELLAECARAAGTTVLLVLDQFEDYLQYHPAVAGSEGFEAQLARAVNREEVDAGFLVALREASLPRLDRFRARIPQLLSHALRLEHLDDEGARAAIGPPVFEQWNRDHPDEPAMSVEPALVDEVIREARVDPARGEQGGQGAAEREAVIEAPFLQLVMARLWRRERELGSRVLRLVTLRQDLGGARRIVRAHLDEVMARLGERQRALCGRCFDRFVTPSGERVPCNIDDLRQWAGELVGEVDATLKALSDGRVLRTVPPDPRLPALERYEVFHDVFAPSVLDWHRAFQREQAQARAAGQARVKARLRWLPALAVATLAALAGLAMSLLYSVESGANRRAIESMLAGADDPEQALELAIDAADRMRRVRWLERADPEIEDALRGAAQATRQAWRRTLAQKTMGVAVAADGRHLVTREVDDRPGHLGSRLTVWTLDADGGVAGATRAFDDPSLLGRVRFMPGGQAVVAVAGRSVWWWPYAAGGEPVELPHGMPIDTALAVHERMPLVAAAGSETRAGMRRGSIKVWRVDAAGRPTLAREIDTGSAWLMGLAFDPGGAFVAASAVDRDAAHGSYVSVWSLASGRRVLEVPMDAGSDALAFAPGGEGLALAGRDNDVRLLRPVGLSLEALLAQADAEAGAATPPRAAEWHEQRLVGHLERVRDLAYSADGRRLASAGADRKVIVWDAATGERQLVLPGHRSWVESVAFTPDGAELASVGRDRTLRLWNTAGHAAGVYAIAFNPDPARRQFATASGDRTARLWDHGPSLPRLQHTLAGHDDTIYRLAFDARGERLATAGFDKTARVWDTRSGALLATFSGHQDQLRAVAFSPDGAWLLTGSADGTARLNSLRDPRAPALRVVHHEGKATQVTAVAPDPLQPRWLSAGWDGVLRLWDYQGRPLGQIATRLASGSAPRFVSAVFVRGGTEVAALGGRDIHFWPLARFGGEAGTAPQVEPVGGARNECFSLATSADGLRLAAACSDGAVHVYDLGTTRPRLAHVLRMHRDWVMGAAFSPDGALLGSAGLDRSFTVSPLAYDALRAHAARRLAALAHPAP